MMLWCELHNTSGLKGGGITNFDPTEYEKDLLWLNSISQVCASVRNHSMYLQSNIILDISRLSRVTKRFINLLHNIPERT